MPLSQLGAYAREQTEEGVNCERHEYSVDVPRTGRAGLRDRPRRGKQSGEADRLTILVSHTLA